MTAVTRPCPDCQGVGWNVIFTGSGWQLCRRCDGKGKDWAPGAPDFGCSIRLGDRIPGEIITLGNGDRGRLLWHSPRKNSTISYLALIGDFDDVEDKNPTAYPSCVGVASVGVPRVRGSDDDHRGDRTPDDIDPMQRGRRGALNM